MREGIRLVKARSVEMTDEEKGLCVRHFEKAGQGRDVLNGFHFIRRQECLFPIVSSVPVYIGPSVVWVPQKLIRLR